MKSKQKLSLLIPVLIITSIVLTGCPYSSNVALDSTPQYKISNDLLGTWKRNQSNRDSTWVKFEKESDVNYKITANLFSTSDRMYEINKFTAFLSYIAKHWILNMKENTTGSYYYVAISFNNGNLTMTAFSDDIEDKFETSKEAKDYFTKELSKPEDKIRFDEGSELKDLKKTQ